MRRLAALVAAVAVALTLADSALAHVWALAPPVRKARKPSLWQRRFATARRVVRLALHYRGVPYVWGGTTPRGFDCSGLVQYVYRRVHRWVPRTTWGQMSTGRRVSLAGLHAGDTVFFYGGEHEALYIGGGLVVHAPHSGDVVRVAPMSEFPGYAGARRFWW